MSGWCLNPFAMGGSTPTISGPLTPISEKLDLKLCPLALSQCQRERVILEPDYHDQISLSHIPRNSNEEQNNEGYFTTTIFNRGNRVLKSRVLFSIGRGLRGKA
eukprot:TRINITY_DN21603_c0_g1_i1.p2 TRINITY_DN21603_c0_g1~~TRINITY_DN21603_c0_g1_i1.p2  ORF type:complete len:104 (+),score=9.82 TRINITY_DN21603_c0_g1_i1:177-488(+)